MRTPALGQSPQAPEWHTRWQAHRPQPSVLPQTRPHWKLRSSHRLLSVTAPHAHAYSPAGAAMRARLSSANLKGRDLCNRLFKSRVTLQSLWKS